MLARPYQVATLIESARPDAAALAQLYALVAPNHAAVMDSHVRTQRAVRE